MNEKRSCHAISVTFHNPNATDETAGFLIKTLAGNMADYLFEQSSASYCFKVKTLKQYEEFAHAAERNIRFKRGGGA